MQSTDTNPLRGKFITLEGADGVGKTTQVHQLADRIRSHLACEVIVTFEPGATPVSAAIRALLLGEGASQSDLGHPADRFNERERMLLFYAARLEHVRTRVLPALRRGAWVLCDRFADSTRVYQRDQTEHTAQLLGVLEAGVKAECWPDLTLLLDAPVHLLVDRMKARSQSVANKGRAGGETPSGTVASPSQSEYETDDTSTTARLVEGFRNLAKSEPDRCVLVDATSSPEEVGDRLWHVLRERFNMDASGA